MLKSSMTCIALVDLSSKVLVKDPQLQSFLLLTVEYLSQFSLSFQRDNDLRFTLNIT